MPHISNYTIATVLSIACACFTAAASWVPNKEKSYRLQVIQCLIYAVASYFFGVYSTIVTVLLCAVRNWLSSRNRFSTKVCIPFCIVMVVLGLLFNNAGWVGLIPVLATLIYSIGCCVCKALIRTKWNILVNLAFWILYDLMIADYPSCVMDTIGAVVAVAAIIRITRDLRNK